MGTTASSSPEPDKEESNTNEEEEEKDTENIPSVYINYEFLNFDIQQKNHKVYEINGNNYTDNLKLHQEFEEYEEFKLYAEKVDVGENEIAIPLEKRVFEVQEVENGYIVNSSIFLNIHHYHTLIKIFDDYLNCFVCDEIVLEEYCGSHIATEFHRRNLTACPILEEYKLRFFRMQNGHYHCGLCNVVFSEYSSSSHSAEQAHANNEIFATKQAEKIIKRNLDRNRNNDAQNENNDNELENEINEVNNEADNIVLDAPVTVKTTKNTFEISYYTWNMIAIRKFDLYYCMACKLQDSIENLTEHVLKISHKNNLEEFKINEQYENHLIRQSDKWCHCSTCNNVHYLGGTDLHFITHEKRKSFTKFAKTIVISENGKNGNNDDVNENNNNGTANNDNYNENDDNGNENNDNDIENNDIVNGYNDERNQSNDNRKENNDSPSTSNKILEVNPHVVNANYETKNYILRSMINDKCTLFLFGLFKIQVSCLSLNVIFCDQFGVFRCELCKVYIHPGALQDHIRSLIHITLFNSTPAVPYYGYNYIRYIHNLPHCGICHMILQPSLLLVHLQDINHIRQTNLALGLVNLPPPPLQVSIPTINLNGNQNLQEERNHINEVNTDTNRNNGNEIHEIKNVINERKNTINDETNNLFDASVKTEKANVYIEVIRRKILEIESKCDDEENTGLFDAKLEVWTKKALVRVSFTSFNTLVPIGDGDRYCFACDIRIESEKLKNHICTETHMESIKSMKFLEEYCNNLIRQKESLYHCAICNTIVRQSELINHMEWTTHEDQLKLSKANVSRKERNTVEYQIKVFPTQIEVITNKIKNQIKDIIIECSYIIKASDTSDSINPGNTQNTNNGKVQEIAQMNEGTSKTNKTIVIEKFNMKLMLKWDAWHSIISAKNKFKCVICNKKLNDIYVDIHINSESHIQKLDKPFASMYFPALIREVNTDMMHCATCNTVLYNKVNLRIHIQGGRHKRCLEDLIIENLDDGNEDVIYV